MTLCLAAIKTIERTKYVGGNGVLIPYNKFEMTWQLLDEAQGAADMFKKYTLYGCDLPNCPQGIHLKFNLVCSFDIEFRYLKYGGYGWTPGYEFN